MVRQENSLSSFSRRDLIKTTSGVALAVGAAGCMTTSDDSNGNNSNGDENYFKNRLRSGTLPTDVHWNMYNTSNHGWVSITVLSEQFAYNPIEGDIMEGVLEDWEITDEKMQMKIHPDATWHDGQDVTAEDIHIKYIIDREMSSGLGNFFDGFEEVDDKTVDLLLSEPTEQSLLEASLFQDGMFLDTPRQFYADIAEQFEDASSDDEIESVQQELLGMTMSVDDDPIGCGPFKFDDADETRLRLVKHEDHHRADQIEIDGYEFLTPPESDYQHLTEGDLDAVTGTPGEEIMEVVPDKYQISNLTRNGGYGWLLNFDDYNFGRRNVRLALCWLYDPRQGWEIEERDYMEGEILEQMPPVGHNFLDQCSQELRDSIFYFNEEEGGRPDLAEELLEEEGYTKEDGDWYRPDDERFEITVHNTGEPTAHLAFEEQLSDFGISVEIDTKSQEVWADEFFAGEFEVFYHWWGWDEIHPHVQLTEEFNASYPDAMSRPSEELPVPMPVGDPDGDIEEINTIEVLDDFATATDEEEAQEHLDLLSWCWNQSACIPQQHGVDDNKHFANTDDWNWPSVEEKERAPKYPWNVLPRFGEVTPK